MGSASLLAGSAVGNKGYGDSQRGHLLCIANGREHLGSCGTKAISKKEVRRTVSGPSELALRGLSLAVS